jgi:UDPglucose 6-dehydrogenase
MIGTDELVVGFMGLGKLGTPVAIAAAQRGHTVNGYDIDSTKMSSLQAGCPSDISPEPGIDEALKGVGSKFHTTQLQDMVDASKIIFVCVETPHDQNQDGSKRLRGAPKDFDYTALKNACTMLAAALAQKTQTFNNAGGNITDYTEIVIVSTVLPGTTRLHLAPIFERICPMTNYRLVYSPSFIAQSTVIEDYQQPEFCLIGLGSDNASDDCPEYSSYLERMHTAPQKLMSWETAEFTKVFYNTYLTFKVMLANLCGQMCDKMAARDGGTYHSPRSHEVMRTLKEATDRLVSTAYMSPGMGDGGGCHPRDNYAMAWLCNTLGMAYNPYEDVMEYREKHAEYLGKQLRAASLEYGTKLTGAPLPMYILGRGFKKGVTQEDGSPSLLVADMINLPDHCVVDSAEGLGSPGAYLLGQPDLSLLEHVLPGSVVVDPWGIAFSCNNYSVRRIG